MLKPFQGRRRVGVAIDTVQAVVQMLFMCSVQGEGQSHKLS